MKKNLMVSLLLSVSLVLAACSQQESVSEPTDVDVPIEQADTVPGGVSVPKEEGAPDTEELDVGAEVVPVEEPVSEETAEPM